MSSETSTTISTDEVITILKTLESRNKVQEFCDVWFSDTYQVFFDRNKGLDADIHLAAKSLFDMDKETRDMILMQNGIYL